jgi:tryptophan-rich sensory protein
MFNIKKYNNYQIVFFAVLFYLIVNLIAGYAITLFVDIKLAYALLNLPSWAPPTFVFGVAWTINNILVILGNIWTLKLPDSIYRTKLIKFQLASWFNYLIFQFLSFGTGVPSMYFWPTFSMLVLTLFSIFYAYKLDKKHKTHITLTFSTLLLWLVLASSLGFYIMMNN